MMDQSNEKRYRLIGADGKEYLSETKGTLGKNKKYHIYGRLDCPSALRYIAKGQYVQYRVFLKMSKMPLLQGTDLVSDACRRPIRNGRRINSNQKIKSLNIKLPKAAERRINGRTW